MRSAMRSVYYSLQSGFWLISQGEMTTGVESVVIVVVMIVIGSAATGVGSKLGVASTALLSSTHFSEETLVELATIPAHDMRAVL